jgi:hypothetical protein
MIWSHLHGDMQGRRVQGVLSTRNNNYASKVKSEIPCRVSNQLAPPSREGWPRTGSYRGNPPCQSGSGQSRGKS